MLDKRISIVPLKDQYLGARVVQSPDDAIPDDAIKAAISAFFTSTLNNFYQYELKEEIDTEKDSDDQRIKVSIKKDAIGLIGEVIFQYSEDDVQMVRCSNLIVREIICSSLSPLRRKQLADDSSFHRLGCSLEKFNQAWELTSKPKPSGNKPTPLEMSYFGNITETADGHDLDDLIYYVMLELQPKRYSLEDGWQWEHRSRIIDALTICLSKNRIIDLQGIEGMRLAAKALGRYSNVVRALPLVGMGVGTSIVAAGVAIIILLAPPGLLIVAASMLMSIGITFFVVGAVGTGAVWLQHLKPGDFQSRAVLYLADKIEKLQLFIPDNAPNSVGGRLQNKAGLPASFDFFCETKKDFDQFCVKTLKPALQEICKNKEVYDSLKEGLASKFNQGESTAQLTSKIKKAVSNKDPLIALYEVCGATKPHLTPK